MFNSVFPSMFLYVITFLKVQNDCMFSAFLKSFY